MRRLLLSLSTFVVSAASFAAPTDDGAALRPTLPPEFDPAPKTASRIRPDDPAPNTLFAIGGGPRGGPQPFAVEDVSGARRPFLDAQDAGLPKVADEAFVSTENLDSALRRQFGATAPLEWPYLFIGGRAPAWICAGAAYDFFRRQDRADWGLGRSTWKGGWEIDFAPSAATLAYAKSFSPDGRALLEGKVGLALDDDLSLPWLPAGKLYLGPFAIMHGLRFDEDAKLGAHMTFAQIGAFHVGLATGYARGRFGPGGAFGLLESSFRF